MDVPFKPQWAQSTVPSLVRFTLDGETVPFADEMPGEPDDLTLTVTSSLPVSNESLAESLNTYVPAALKFAVVFKAFGDPNVTVPGPLTMLQVAVTVAGGFGNPSSVAAPLKVAEDGNVIV